jgi:hypothetical protein
MIPELVPPPKSPLDPCPCGSGRNYLECCWWKRQIWEQRRTPRFTTRQREAARAAKVWQVDWVPFPNHFEGSHSDIWASLPIIASRHLIYAPTCYHSAESIQRLAEGEAEDIAWVAHHVGSSPAVIQTRDAEFADALCPFLERFDIAVEQNSDLAEFDAVARRFFRRYIKLMEDDYYSLGARVWSAWEQGGGWLLQMFHALADIFRLRPWDDLTPERSIVVDQQGEPTWYLDVLPEPNPAILVYSDPYDRARLRRWRKIWIPGLHGRAYRIDFLSRDEIFPAAVGEVERLELPLADDSAFPWLNALNTPACMLPWDDALRLVETLRMFTVMWPEMRNRAVSGGIWSSKNRHTWMRFTLQLNP